MLHLKYAPKNISECVVNSNIIKDLNKYLLNDDINTFCYINGETGSGKSLTTNLVIKNLGLHSTEVNYIDKIKKEFLYEKINKTRDTILIFEDSHLYENDLLNALNENFKKRKTKNKYILISDNNEIKTNLNYIILTTKITNVKQYKNFITGILKKENIKIKNISNYILKNGPNVRNCINHINHSKDLYESYYKKSNTEILHRLSDNISLKRRFQLMNNDFLNLQYLYFENIGSYKIDIKTRIIFSNAMIFCDQLNTYAYNFQHWEILKYIIYCSSIKCSMILPSPNFILKKSTTWSSYSNLCSKTNKMNIIFINELFLYNFEIVKYVKKLLLTEIKRNDVIKIKNIIMHYNIKSYLNLIDILQIGTMKKIKIKNINIVKKLY